VFGEIWAVACGFALDIHLLGEAAFHEGLQAIVDSRQGNGGNALLGSYKNLGCCRVITVCEKHIVNLAPLWSEAMAAMADRLFVGGLGCLVHRKQEYIAALNG
jgi:hypothetical protein